MVESKLETSQLPDDVETKPEQKKTGWFKRLFHRSGKLNDFNERHDIKYRGPLSYRHMRIIGWVAMGVSQAAVVLAMCVSIWSSAKPDSIGIIRNLTDVSNVLSYFQLLPLPLFLIANFSIILKNRKEPLKLLKSYGLFTVIFILLYIFILEHYLITLLSNIVYAGEADPRMKAIEAIEKFLRNKFTHGLSLNVFVDLLLCVIFYIFASYTPKNGFKDKKSRIIFRCLVILPIAYEVVSYILKCSNALGTIHVPLYVYPFLTNKPILMYVAFIVLTLFFVFREKIYMARGGNKEQYEKFLTTNINSLHFAVFASIVFLVFGGLDMILTFTSINGDNLTTFLAFGIGDSMCMIFAIPFLLLFDYTKTHKSTTFDKFLPIMGVVLVALVYIEGFFQIIMSVIK